MEVRPGVGGSNEDVPGNIALSVYTGSTTTLLPTAVSTSVCILFPKKTRGFLSVCLT